MRLGSIHNLLDPGARDLLCAEIRVQPIYFLFDIGAAVSYVRGRAALTTWARLGVVTNSQRDAHVPSRAHRSTDSYDRGSPLLQC